MPKKSCRLGGTHTTRVHKIFVYELRNCSVILGGDKRTSDIAAWNVFEWRRGNGGRVCAPNFKLPRFQSSRCLLLLFFLDVAWRQKRHTPEKRQTRHVIRREEGKEANKKASRTLTFSFFLSSNKIKTRRERTFSTESQKRS